MITLTLTLNGQPLYIPARWRRVMHGSTINGYAALIAEVNVPEVVASRIFNAYGRMEATLTDGFANELWRGFVEDVEVQGGRVAIRAFGYGRALYHVPYTGFFVATTSAGWRAITDEMPDVTSERYAIDNNNRLYIALNSGDSSNTANMGGLWYDLPDGSQTDARDMAFDYDMAGFPSHDYRLEVRALNSAYTTLVSAVINTTSATASGSATVALPANTQAIAVLFYRNSATPHENTGDTGDIYARLTNLRVAMQAGEVRQSTIAAEVVAYAQAANPDHITGLVDYTAAGIEFGNEIYEDTLPIDILRHVTQANGNRFAVWGNAVELFPGDHEGELLNVRVADIQYQRSAMNTATEAYATYRGARIDRAATAVTESDVVTPDRIGARIRRVVGSNSASVSVANEERDAFLSDMEERLHRVTVQVQMVTNRFGAIVPLENIRAGDVLSFDAIDSSVPGLVERFVIGRCDYDHEAGTLTAEPLEPVPTLVTLIAARSARR
jgi:hypothetical protein